jgi:2'-5' RNA ligase
MAQLDLFAEMPVERAAAEKDQANYQYFLLLTPERSVSESVVSLKEKLHRQIGISKENRASKPHISLLLTPLTRECDEAVIGLGEALLAGMRQFDVNIKGADLFLHSKTASVVLKVEKNPGIEEAFEKLNAGFGMKADVSGFVPHLTIARSIPKHIAAGSILSLEEYNYYSSFRCKSVTVLKRQAYSDGYAYKPLGKYKKIHEIALCA